MLLLHQAVYHYDYVHSVRGKVAPTTKTVDLDRALHAYKLQSSVSSENLVVPSRNPFHQLTLPCVNAVPFT